MTVYVFPGQGSQSRGMGADLFDEFGDVTRSADAVLGYSIAELCRSDPSRQLNSTQFTQPALYVVNALSLMKRAASGEPTPACVAGHSLGEFSALYAAGAFSFETGLRLVKRRGELMSQAPRGAMAAVLGPPAQTVEQILADGGFDDIDIANYNSPVQTVISGPAASISRAEAAFDRPGITYIVLNVSAAFHSRCMKFMVGPFGDALANETMLPLRLPVLANVTAEPYRDGGIAETLLAQICAPVRWTDTVRRLLALEAGPIVEVGPGAVLTTLTKVISAAQPGGAKPAPTRAAPAVGARSAGMGDRLGSAEFRAEHGVKYAYAAGSMADGASGPEMVARLAQAGLLGLFGSADLPLTEIEAGLDKIQAQVPRGVGWGVGLPADPPGAQKLVELLLRRRVPLIEVAASRDILAPVAEFRLKGLHLDPDGRATGGGRVMAKTARLDLAEIFMSPPPPELVARLRTAGRISEAEAAAASQVALAQDVVAATDGGGPTEGAVAWVLIPAMLRLRGAMQTRHGLRSQSRVGAAGGLGAPEALAAAFALGVDFVMTGSINLCTPQAALDASVKDELMRLGEDDTARAPAEVGFETGAVAQVMSKGVLFHARANKLRDYWQRYRSWDEAPDAVRRQLETDLFRAPFAAVCEDLVRAGRLASSASPREQWLEALKWYLRQSRLWGRAGDADRRLDHQIWVGPALAASNQWLSNTPLEDWRARHVDTLGVKLMEEAASLLRARLAVHG